MQVTPIVIMQVPTSIAVMQVLTFHCNYVGGTFCYSYVGGPFCCSYAGGCFWCNYAVRVNMFLQWISEWQVLLKLCWWESMLQLCRCYFLQCIMHMTDSYVIMLVTVFVVAVYVAVSSIIFIFLSLTDNYVL